MNANCNTIQIQVSNSPLCTQGLMTTFATNAVGPLLMAKYFGEHLTKGSGEFGQSPSEGHSGTLVNMSARVGSISDNGEGVLQFLLLLKG